MEYIEENGSRLFYLPVCCLKATNFCLSYIFSVISAMCTHLIPRNVFCKILSFFSAKHKSFTCPEKIFTKNIRFSTRETKTYIENTEKKSNKTKVESAMLEKALTLK